MPVDPQSLTWQAVTKAIAEDIASARKRLERTGLDLPQTEFERGRIAALRQIESLAQPREQIPVEPPQYD